MVKTILFGELNSRKKYTKKIVANAFEENGVLKMSILYYEKLQKRWQFITNDLDKIPCNSDEFIRIKKLYSSCGGTYEEKRVEEAFRS